jgi:hypothetical protein
VAGLEIVTDPPLTGAKTTSIHDCVPFVALLSPRLCAAGASPSSVNDHVPGTKWMVIVSGVAPLTNVPLTRKRKLFGSLPMAIGATDVSTEIVREPLVASLSVTSSPLIDFGSIV